MFIPDNPIQPEEVDVHYMIEDVISALPKYLDRGYSLVIEPFSTDQGQCAVLQDSRGTRLGILEKPIESDLSVRH